MHAHFNPPRPKLPQPVFWERPYFPSWDPNVHYVNYHSQDDNYFDDYYNHRQTHNDCCRYDSDSNINANNPKLMSPPAASPSNYGGYCSNRFYTKPPPMHQCYSCERSTSQLAMSNASKFNKVQRNYIYWMFLAFVNAYAQWIGNFEIDMIIYTMPITGITAINCMMQTWQRMRHFIGTKKKTNLSKWREALSMRSLLLILHCPYFWHECFFECLFNVLCKTVLHSMWHVFVLFFKCFV